MAPPLALIRLRFPALLLAVALVSGAVGWALSQAAPAPRRTVAHRAAAGPMRLPTGWSYIAVARRPTLVVYRVLGGRHRRWRTLTNALSAGAPLALLVRRAGARWHQVYLPIRPDGVTGWVRARDVRLLTTAYSLVVLLRSHRLLLYVGDHERRSFKIGVGRAVTPTPTGTYFITELLKQPNPHGLYGPFAFGLSAYSGVLRHFGRGGNGQVGIHGTDKPWLVGTDVSHGCIRLRNPDIVWLTKRLPLGTPVTITRA